MFKRGRKNTSGVRQNRKIIGLYQMHDILPFANGDGVGGGDAVHLVGGHDHRHVRHVARFQHLSGTQHSVGKGLMFISRAN